MPRAAGPPAAAEAPTPPTPPSPSRYGASRGPPPGAAQPLLGGGEGEGGSGAGSPGEDGSAPVGGGENFPQRPEGGGRIGPCGSCAPAPAPRGGRRRRGAAPRPTRRPAGPEDARGAAEEGGRVARGRASAGAAWRGAVCVPARPRGAVCPPRPRLIMSVVLGGTTPPHPKFMTAEPQTAQGWESCTSSEVELKLR